MTQDKTDKAGVRRRTRYPDSMREQAVRMVGEARRDDGLSLWEACMSVSKLLGPHAESIRQWVARGEVDAGVRPGVTSEATEELKRLRRENTELRRANDILKAAASFFGAELDRQSRK
jgi:transposase